MFYADNFGNVSILPRLATGILLSTTVVSCVKFLFFPVLRRGSISQVEYTLERKFLFFPVLRRGSVDDVEVSRAYVSILPRLATGIDENSDVTRSMEFLFFPVLRRGSVIP